MQILMSDAAHQRVRDDLATMDGKSDVVTVDPAGVFTRAGRRLDPGEVDPEIVWVSLDVYKSGQLPEFFGYTLKSASAKWAHVFAAGLDNPAFTRLMSKGLRLTKSSAQAPVIAEYVMCHALSLLHPIEEFRAAQRAHEWTRLNFREIASTQWLMVGFGSIGTEIARRLQPFGAPLTIVRRSVSPEALAADVRPTSDLPGLLPSADLVVLACALNNETRGIAGRAFFEAMKPGAILINVARGGLVDETALQAGLDRDQPAAAVLDVFGAEPLPADSWFWDHPKVRVTAHCSGAGDRVLARGDPLFLENLRRFRSGAPLLNEAHPSEVGL